MVFKENDYFNQENEIQHNNENTFLSNVLQSSMNKTYQCKSLQNFDLGSNKFELKKKCKRFIDDTPFKVLDAPYIQDDFYLNILDWSLGNNLAVGLANQIYIWNFDTNEVDKLSEFDQYVFASCLSWDLNSERLCIGAQNGKVQIWDYEKKQQLLELNDHTERVGAISLFNNYLITGSKDSSIFFYDLRTKFFPIKEYESHNQEICGLKWSPNQEYFASGGNDNKLFLFSPKTTLPIMKKNHKAAVKALAWSNNHQNILVTGGGTADRCLRLWDVNKKKLIGVKDTGSQICNVLFNKKTDEIISSHGFSNNEINIWNYKDLNKVCSLTGHSQRVLYLAQSPSGDHIVSGAGDETLRFWNLNYSDQKNKSFSKNKLFNPIVLR